ncbi:hypothetical protein JTZ45_002507 [Escherichia coli]|nr:hypothetical protein [Escherichia coli]
MKTITEIKNEAQELLFKFKQGQISKNVLYAEGFTLTMHFNEAMNNASDDPAFFEIKNTAIALQLIKHLATS